jgi:hypothetical protein
MAKKTQIQKFREAARKLKTDDREAAFNEVLRVLGSTGAKTDKELAALAKKLRGPNKREN